MASKYTAGGGGARGDMRGFNFGPPPGTTTYGGSGQTFARSRALYAGPGMQGDPGFFDFIGKVVKTGLGVVSKLGIPLVSGAAGVAGGLLGGGRGPGMSQPLFAPGGRPMLMQGGVPVTQRRPGIIAAGQAMVPGGQTGMGAGCGQGFRPNKSGYYVNGGQYVEPGSVCVKRRRMNPLNPRALSKAMRRIESAKRATTVLGRITIRKKC